jgi:hypothetical protein
MVRGEYMRLSGGRPSLRAGLSEDRRPAHRLYSPNIAGRVTAAMVTQETASTKPRDPGENGSDPMAGDVTSMLTSARKPTRRPGPAESGPDRRPT